MTVQPHVTVDIFLVIDFRVVPPVQVVPGVRRMTSVILSVVALAVVEAGGGGVVVIWALHNCSGGGRSGSLGIWSVVEIFSGCMTTFNDHPHTSITCVTPIMTPAGWFIYTLRAAAVEPLVAPLVHTLCAVREHFCIY